MSNICDRQMIDAMALEENGTLVLIIFDHLQWDCAIRYRHASMLQDKINDYLEFIGSDEIDEHYSKDQYQRIVIRIIAKNSYSQYCIEFLKRVQTFIRENVSQCDLEWTHLQSEGDTEVQYNDGFSDEYVFDTQTSHIKKLVRTLKNQYFSSQNSNYTTPSPYDKAFCIYFGSR